MLTKQEIIRKYIGVPYEHKGRSLQSLDCYGLIALVYRDLGIDLPDYEYADKWYKDGKNYYVEYYHQLWKKVEDLQEWDVILFRNASKVVNHIGLYIGENKFLHCYENTPVEVSDLTRRYWDKCKYGYFRYKGTS